MTVINQMRSTSKVDLESLADSAFFEAIVASNPFEPSRISDPSQMDVDTPSVNALAHNRMQTMAEEALGKQTALGMMLMGGAGTGKSHLLSRMARVAKQEKSCFLFLHNIQVSPKELPRYLLKCCVSKLADDRRENFDDTLLFDIVHNAICHAARTEDIRSLNSDNYDEAQKRLMLRLDGDEEIFKIIFSFYYAVRKLAKKKDGEKNPVHAAKAALAARWLKGDLLDVSEAKSLGLRVDEGVENVRLAEHQIKPAFLTIARLAAEANRKFIICFDQCENMDEESVSSLARFVHALIDGGQDSSNLLVIVSGVKADLLRYIKEDIIPPAAADRLNSRHPVELHRLHRNEVKQILHERLSHFFHRFDAIAVQCKPFFSDDTLFPLGDEWFASQEPDAHEIRPRDALMWASERWRSIQNDIRRVGGSDWLRNWKGTSSQLTKRTLTASEKQDLVDKKISDKIEEAINMRRIQPGQLPADASNLLGLTKSLLQFCKDRPDSYTLQEVTQPHKTCDELLVTESFQKSVIRNQVKFIVTGSATSAATKLRQLLNAPECDHRILVTEDERCPLHLGPAGKNYLDALLQLGPRFTHIKLTFRQYAEMDALMAVVGEARSSDLEVELGPGEIFPISEKDVTDLYHRKGHFRQSSLLKPFLSEGITVDETLNDVPQENGFRQHVLGKLSLLTGANLIELVRGHLKLDANDVGQLGKVLPTAREIVMRMHEEELVCAQPWDNDLYLTIGNRA